MKTAKSALQQREPQVFNPPAFNACGNQSKRKAVRSHKPIFWIQMQIIKDWWIFTSSSESLSVVFITGAFAILILGEKKGQKATPIHFCELRICGDTQEGKWPLGTSLGRFGLNPDPALIPLNFAPFCSPCPAHWGQNKAKLPLQQRQSGSGQLWAPNKQ